MPSLEDYGPLWVAGGLFDAAGAAAAAQATAESASVPVTAEGAVNGVATLDGTGSVLSGQLGNTRPVPGMRIACMGNSIASNGNTPAGSTAELWGQVSDFSYLQWACLLSGGRLRYAGSYSTGGATSSAILATWLADVVAAKPDMCVVGPMFTNNNGVVSFAQTVADIETAVTALLGAGIIPVLSLDPPKSTSSADGIFIRKCAFWAQRYAAYHAIPVVDFCSPLANADGTWISSYNNAADGIHPNGAGAQVMGQALSDAVLGASRSNAPLVYPVQISGDTTSLVSNQLLLTDSNSDGVPDGWVFTGTGGGTAALSADGSSPASPRVAARGNLSVVTRGTADTSLISSTPYSVTAGHRLHFSAHVESAVHTAGGTSTLRLVDSATVSTLYGLSFSTDIPSGCVISGEIVVPAGTTAVKVLSSVLTGSGAVMKFGQITVIDLTAQGMTA